MKSLILGKVRGGEGRILALLTLRRLELRILWFKKTATTADDGKITTYATSGGLELTPEVIQRLVDQAEQGYEKRFTPNVRVQDFMPPPEIKTLGGQAAWLLQQYPGDDKEGKLLYQWQLSAALLVAQMERA